ncbi:hypothetical protein RQN30_02290 [Arcanobacterium hippocoleae]
MRKLGDTTGITKLTSGVKHLGTHMLSIAQYAATASAALGGVAVKAAADLEQSTGAVKDVFKQYATTVETYSRKASSAVGLSANSYNELATLLGTQLKNGGTAIDQIAGKTDQLIKLGADLAAGFGGSTAEAVQALSSALKGERDPIERYGVSLTQATIDAQAAALGFHKVGGSLSTEAQQVATLSLIMQQTSDFHGKFAAENDTLAHKAQVVKAKLTNMAATLGKLLLPIVSRVVDYFDANLMPIMQKFFAWLSDNAIPKIKELAGNFQANWLPALQNIGSTIISVLIPAITSLVGWISNNSSVLLPLAAGITSGVAAWKAFSQAMKIVQSASAVINLIKIGTDAWKTSTEGMTLAQKALNLAQKASPIGIIITAITALVGVVITLWNTNENFRTAILNAWNSIKTGFSGIVNWFRTLPSLFVQIVANIGNGIRNGFNSVVSFMRSIPSKILNALGNLGSLLLNAGKNVIQGFLDGIKSMWNTVKIAFPRLPTGSQNGKALLKKMQKYYAVADV